MVIFAGKKSSLGGKTHLAGRIIWSLSRKIHVAGMMIGVRGESREEESPLFRENRTSTEGSAAGKKKRQSRAKAQIKAMEGGGAGKTIDRKSVV